MIVTIIVIVVITLAFLGLISFLYPDSAYWVASSVLTPEQINSATVDIPYTEPISVIPILPFVIIGFILIIMLVVVRGK
jgi:hypothetical protein